MSVLDSANSFVQTAEGLESSLDLGLDIPNFNKDFNDPLGNVLEEREQVVVNQRLEYLVVMDLELQEKF